MYLCEEMTQNLKRVEALTGRAEVEYKKGNLFDSLHLMVVANAVALSVVLHGMILHDDDKEGHGETDLWQGLWRNQDG